MTTSAWEGSTFVVGDYTIALNWSAGVPNMSNDIALFGTSTQTIVDIPDTFVPVGAWVFSAEASQYNFAIIGALYFDETGDYYKWWICPHIQLRLNRF
jgi:hypothetical protein